MDSIDREFALLLMVSALVGAVAVRLRQSVMEELLLGSVTKHVLAHSSSDVFIAGQITE